MILIVKNTTSDAYSFLSDKVVLPPESTTEIHYLNWYGLSFETQFLANLRNNNFLLSDGIDFLNNPKSEEYFRELIKSTIATRDVDGANIVRTKAGQAGWKAQFHAIRINTSTTNGFHNKNRLGEDLGFCTYKMYDVNDEETQSEQSCVKTVVTWEPNHNMEIVGGRLFQKTSPNTDVWVWVTAAPHIPANLGGSVEFLQGGMCLSDVMDGGGVDFDGRAAKYIQYDSQYHSGRFEITIKHDAGIKHKFSIVFELFKP